MILDPLEVLKLYAEKNMTIAYCDTDRSRLGLAERMADKGVIVIDMSDPNEEDTEIEVDVAILVYTKDWNVDFQDALNEISRNFILISGEGLIDGSPPATEEEHGWKEM